MSDVRGKSATAVPRHVGGGDLFGPRRFISRSSIIRCAVALHAATTLASKGLGAANRLIVAGDTLKLRATSACASPLESR
jgi:hypothetical protein